MDQPGRRAFLRSLVALPAVAPAIAAIAQAKPQLPKREVTKDFPPLHPNCRCAANRFAAATFAFADFGPGDALPYTVPFDGMVTAATCRNPHPRDVYTVRIRWRHLSTGDGWASESEIKLPTLPFPVRAGDQISVSLMASTVRMEMGGRPRRDWGSEPLIITFKIEEQLPKVAKQMDTYWQRVYPPITPAPPVRIYAPFVSDNLPSP